MNIRDYQLIAPMGKGASATVWHAIHRGIKPCAVKVFEGDATNPETRELFLNEMRTAMSFTHGSVVQVFDAGEDDGRLWMACEWVDGVSIQEFNRVLWERGGTWPFDLAAYTIGRLLTALVYVHEFTIAGARMHVRHRDVKPGNVLISAGGEIKLTDFGVAKMWKDDSYNEFRGTFRYVSIEHFRGRATQQSDLFGAGAVLHEMLTNKPFRYPHASDLELYKAILEDVSVPELHEDVPVVLRALHRGLLAPAEERVACARDAHASLMQWPHYRPGELGLANFFETVMGRRGRSGVTTHDGAQVPMEPLWPKHSEPTLFLAPLCEVDAPQAYRRRPTEIISPPIELPEDSSEIKVNVYFRKAASED